MDSKYVQQFKKGSLEMILLCLIAKKETYGYEIIESLHRYGFPELSEGTIYPILLRLEKQGSLFSELLPSPLGPKRKYFTITPQGHAYLQAFQKSWETISQATARILEQERA